MMKTKVVTPAPISNAVQLLRPERTWRRLPAWFRDALVLGGGAWLAKRLVLAVMTWAILLTVAALGHPISEYYPQIITTPHDLFWSWDRFDVRFYVGIATQGYTTYTAVFFPLLPLLIRGTIAVAPFSPYAAGMLMANLCTLVGCIGLVCLVRQEGGGTGDDAGRALRLLLLSPVAFFLAAAYSEGPLLAAVTWGLWATRRRQWWIVALCAFLAGLARPTGAVLALAIAWELGREWYETWQRYGWHRIEPPWRTSWPWPRLVAQAAALLAVPLALALFSLYLAHAVGDPLAWVHSHTLYNQRTLSPLMTVPAEWATTFQQGPWSYLALRNLIDYAPILLVPVLVVVALVRREMPVSFALYTVGLWFLAAATPMVWPGGVFPVSSARYLLLAVPLLLVVARWCRRVPGLELGLLGLGAMLQVCTLALFLTWHWMV